MLTFGRHDKDDDTKAKTHSSIARHAKDLSTCGAPPVAAHSNSTPVDLKHIACRVATKGSGRSELCEVSISLRSRTGLDGAKRPLPARRLSHPPKVCQSLGLDAFGGRSNV
jgi:hypothetical protein|eukprot:7101486-Prymnesium_polylepis.2